MTSPRIPIAVGEKWGKTGVLAAMGNRGIVSSQEDEMLYKVETRFAVLASHRMCNAEWSIRFAEVTGKPEDLQFDIDALREEALDRVAEEMGD